MTPIEKQFQEAIIGETIVTIKNGDYVVGDTDLASEACYKIHKSECLAFLRWVQNNEWELGYINRRTFTYEELFEIYQQTKMKL